MDSLGEPQAMRYRRSRTEIAVLVGDYPSVDDPDGPEGAEETQIRQAAVHCRSIEW